MPILFRFIALCSFCFLLSACTQTQYAAHVAKQIPLPSDPPVSKGTYKVGTPYRIAGRAYQPVESYNFTETGMASWYGPKFHGKRTANGEIFDKNELTAAHRTLQMPSIIRVTNLGNGRSLFLRVNDRGPFAHDRVLDVSERAATLLGFKNQGTAKVRIEIIPEASQQVAMMAREGQDTRGFEIALNRNRGADRTDKIVKSTGTEQIWPPVQQAAAQTPSVYETSSPGASLKPVRRVALSDRGTLQIENNSQNYAQPRATERQPSPVLPPGQSFFVQAGSFSQEENALSYSRRVASIAPSFVVETRVQGLPYYRVRLGPFPDREAAQIAQANLRAQGNQSAAIVVDG